MPPRRGLVEAWVEAVQEGSRKDGHRGRRARKRCRRSRAQEGGLTLLNWAVRPKSYARENAKPSFQDSRGILQYTNTVSLHR